MAKIYYSVSGEGRGHATRASAIVDTLRHRHEITLFAPEQAYEFLAPRYAARHSRVRVYPLPGLRFHYRHGRLAVLRSITKGVQFWAQASDAVDQLSVAMRADRPELVITDFEPLLPRAAERMNVPYISFDHQHFLTSYDLSDLPFSLRGWATLMKIAVAAHYTRQRTTVVTSFFQLPLMPNNHHVISVGPIVRRAIAEAIPSREGYLISYLRKHTPDRVLQHLKSAPFEVRVYGLGARPSEGNLQFRPFDERRFVKDLAGCLAVVGSAGNQTLGEAIYLGKPVLALPEDNHFEQRINAFYLQRQNCGQSVNLSKFCEQSLAEFLESIDDFQPFHDLIRRTGNQTALEAIESTLGTSLSKKRVA